VRLSFLFFRVPICLELVGQVLQQGPAELFWRSHRIGFMKAPTAMAYGKGGMPIRRKFVLGLGNL
jgi:hypothetical protein